MCLGAVILVLGTEHFGQLIGGHQPFTLAILVPLMEFAYSPTCSQTCLEHL